VTVVVGTGAGVRGAIPVAGAVARHRRVARATGVEACAARVFAVAVVASNTAAIAVRVKSVTT